MIISISFSNTSSFDQSCSQNQFELIDNKEPFYEHKKNKCYESKYIEDGPVVDGILDESVWGDFTINDIDYYIHTFIQEEPNNMSNPRFNTLVKIIHDDENIYIAARLFDTNPDSVKEFYREKMIGIAHSQISQIGFQLNLIVSTIINQVIYLQLMQLGFNRMLYHFLIQITILSTMQYGTPMYLKMIMAG